MFIFEIIAELLVGWLWAAGRRPESPLGESRLERGLARFWWWVGGGVLCLATVAGLYLWLSRSS